MSEQTKDQSVLDKIQTLVTEEHRMFGKGSLSDSDRARLEKINVELDQCRTVASASRSPRNRWESGGRACSPAGGRRKVRAVSLSFNFMKVHKRLDPTTDETIRH